jgi:hypothetical protein
MGVLLLLLTPVCGFAADREPSSPITREWRHYISDSVAELSGRAEILRKVISHKETARELLRKVPPSSTAELMISNDLLGEAKTEVSQAQNSLQRARTEAGKGNLREAEKQLSVALRGLTRARQLLATSN